jgi:hypothetical protein
VRLAVRTVPDPARRMYGESVRESGGNGTEVCVAIELSLFNNSVTTLVNHLTSYYGEDAELDTYVICARVKAPDIPGGSGLNWIVGPNGHEHAPGLLRGVLEALENDDSHGPGG